VANISINVCNGLIQIFNSNVVFCLLMKYNVSMCLFYDTILANVCGYSMCVMCNV